MKREQKRREIKAITTISEASIVAIVIGLLILTVWLSYKNTVKADKMIDVCERIRNIDFKAKEYPIDTQVCDEGMMSRIHKAYCEAISNQTPIGYEEDGAEYFRDIIGSAMLLDNKEVYEELVKKYKYRYMDCNGDGLPELVIDSGEDGLRILKYNLLTEQAEIYSCPDSRWRLLGANQVYRHDVTDNIKKTHQEEIYQYETLDPQTGRRAQKVSFIISHDENEGDCWEVEIEEYKDGIYLKAEKAQVSEAVWNDLTHEYFEALEQPVELFAFEEVFEEDDFRPKTKKENIRDVTDIYNKFLKGERCAKTICMKEIIEEKEKKDEENANKESDVRYVIYDVTGDDIPELHIQTRYDYYILKYENDILFVWTVNPLFYFRMEEGYYSILEDGALFYQMEDSYNHYCDYDYCKKMEESANAVGKISFTRADCNKNGIYDNHDIYEFANENCTKEEWKSKAGEYLVMDEADRILGVKNQVEWTVYGEGRYSDDRNGR